MTDLKIQIEADIEVLAVSGTSTFRDVQVVPPDHIEGFNHGPSMHLPFEQTLGRRTLSDEWTPASDLWPRNFYDVCTSIRDSANAGTYYSKCIIGTAYSGSGVVFGDLVRIYEISVKIVTDSGVEVYRPGAVAVDTEHPSGAPYLTAVGDAPLGDDSDATYVDFDARGIGAIWAESWLYRQATEQLVTRLWPRDDALGLGTANRLVPTPRANRIIGRQP